MERQDNNFLGSESFGVQPPTIISEETASLIFGDPNPDASTLEKVKDPEKKETPTVEEPVKEEEKIDPLTADDILGPAEGEDESTESTEPESTEVEDGNTPTGEVPFDKLTTNLVALGIFTDNPEIPLPKNGEEFRDRWIAEKQTQPNQDMYNFLFS